MDDDVVIRRVDGAMDAVVDGRTVLLSPRDFSYHGLDPVGARIWGLVEQPRTVGEVVAALVEAYDVEPDRCRADLLPFVVRMVDIGTLETDPALS